MSRGTGRQLVQQNKRESRHLQTRERREARAQRILDAAAILTLPDSYDKTSIEDIAKEASIGKGTLYLHWSVREALFAALSHPSPDLRRRAAF